MKWRKNTIYADLKLRSEFAITKINFVVFA